MAFFSDERATELRDLFFESAQELLQALNDEGLELERKPRDPEILRDIRRTVHTLKGDSAACGFRELSELAHEMEDAFTAAFHKTITPLWWSLFYMPRIFLIPCSSRIAGMPPCRTPTCSPHD